MSWLNTWMLLRFECFGFGLSGARSCTFTYFVSTFIVTRSYEYLFVYLDLTSLESLNISQGARSLIFDLQLTSKFSLYPVRRLFWLGYGSSLGHIHQRLYIT